MPLLLNFVTQFSFRPYVKGWLPRQHQSVLSVDDKKLINVLYPPPHATHQWADPLATPEPLEEDEEDEDEESEEEEDSESLSSTRSVFLRFNTTFVSRLEYSRHDHAILDWTVSIMLFRLFDLQQ